MSSGVPFCAVVVVVSVTAVVPSVVPATSFDEWTFGIALARGAAGEPGIPTVGSWGIGVFAGTLALMALYVMRRRFA